MKRTPIKGNFNYGESNWKSHGCRACEHNPMGVCEVIQREIPINFVTTNGEPVWCPLKKKKNRKRR